MSLFRTIIFSVVLTFPGILCSQPAYQFTLTTSKYICEKAAASLEIKPDPTDSISITWSTGQLDTKVVYELTEGDYSVRVRIKYKPDSVTTLTKDTTLLFTIEKELCGIGVDTYFSPNDDNYHDMMGISNTSYHPDFELNIFNKWGQRIHVQRKEYTPWNGKWNGIDLPDGTYYYVFFYNSADKTKFVKGDVTILR